MQKKIFTFILISSILLIYCAAPKDPVEKFILYMNKRLNILEKYKNDPVLAGIELEKYNLGKEKELNELKDDLKRYNNDITDEKNQAIMERLKPIMDRMIKLIGDSPTLLLDERVAGAFEAFDLGL